MLINSVGTIFSNAWQMKWNCSVVSNSSQCYTIDYQAPLSMDFSMARILEWVAIPFSRGWWNTLTHSVGAGDVTKCLAHCLARWTYSPHVSYRIRTHLLKEISAHHDKCCDNHLNGNYSHDSCDDEHRLCARQSQDGWFPRGYDVCILGAVAGLRYLADSSTCCILWKLDLGCSGKGNSSPCMSMEMWHPSWSNKSGLKVSRPAEQRKRVCRGCQPGEAALLDWLV